MKTYEIHELSKASKKAATEEIKRMDSFAEQDVDLDWVIENETEDLEALGLENVEISFSGFWSQGDGASFTARVDDIPKFMKSIGIDTSDILDKALKAIPDVYDMYIVRTDSRYVHENTVRFEIENIDDTELIIMTGFGLGDITVDLNDILVGIDFEVKASKWVKEKSREIYDKLEKAYGEEFSEDAAEEWADQWEIQFDEEGNEV
jgi:hypothetical protein